MFPYSNNEKLTNSYSPKESEKYQMCGYQEEYREKCIEKEKEDRGEKKYNMENSDEYFFKNFRNMLFRKRVIKIG